MVTVGQPLNGVKQSQAASQKQLTKPGSSVESVELREGTKTSTQRVDPREVYYAKQAEINAQIKAGVMQKISASQITTLPSNRIYGNPKSQVKNRSLRSTDSKMATRYSFGPSFNLTAMPKIDTNLQQNSVNQSTFSQMIAKRKLLFNAKRKSMATSEFTNDNKEFFQEYDRIYDDTGDVVEASMMSVFNSSTVGAKFGTLSGFYPYQSRMNQSMQIPKIVVQRKTPSIEIKPGSQLSLYSQTKKLEKIISAETSDSNLKNQLPELKSRSQTVQETYSTDEKKPRKMLDKRLRRPTLRSVGKYSKQQLCRMLQSTQTNYDSYSSPTRITNLYAMINASKTFETSQKEMSSTSKFFNESKKLSVEEQQKLSTMNHKIASFASVGKHKDTVSKLSEAINKFKKSPRREIDEDDDVRLGIANQESEALDQSNTPQKKNYFTSKHKTKKKFGNSTLGDVQIDSRPLFCFRDNLDVECFLKMNFNEKLEWKIKPSQVEKVFWEKLPVVLKKESAVRASKSLAEFSGFWHRIPLFGSGTPAAREGASMVCVDEKGKSKLFLFGGNVLTTGAAAFEAFSVDLTTFHWKKFDIEKNILMPTGTKPALRVIPDSQEVEMFLFSGQAPISRINSGIRLCTQELMTFNTETVGWQKMRQNSMKSVTARKNFAISFCHEFLIITGGTDANLNQLHDCVRYSLIDGEWFHLTQKREWDENDQEEDAEELDGDLYEEEFGEISLQRHHQKSLFEASIGLGNQSIFKAAEEQDLLGEGSQIVPDVVTKKKRRKLLHRSHHTMDTILVDKEKVKGGYTLCSFKSYVFGGLFMNEATKCQEASNHLVEISTKSMVVDFTYTGDKDEIMQPPSTFTFSECMTAKVKLLESRNGFSPLPRRDHSSCLISNNQYLVIYGGRNDQALSKQNQANLKRRESVVSSYSEIEKTSDGTTLSDIMLFSFERKLWVTLAQMGFPPEPRWGACMASCDTTNQIFLFGGCTQIGSCRNEVFCLEINPDEVEEKVKQLRRAQNEIQTAHKRIKNNSAAEKKNGISTNQNSSRGKKK